VNMPPRHGKSELLSVWLPAWFLDLFPDRRVIVTSYGASVAGDLSRKTRAVFGVENIHHDSKAVMKWNTPQGGGMFAAGVGGPITGRGGDLLLCDDPHKNFDDANSEKLNDSIHNWWRTTFETREEPGSSIIVVMTRWTTEDLTAWLLDNVDRDWDHIVIPAIAGESDPIGRQEGEALWPDRYDIDWLKKKRSGNSQTFEAMYQQNPDSGTGHVWLPEWWKRWTGFAKKGEWTSDRVPHPDESSWIQSWDLATKGNENSSYVCGQVWASKNAHHYLVHEVREKLSFTETLQAMRNVRAAYPYATLTLVEDKANGPAVMNVLRNELGGLVPVEPFGSKLARARAVSPYIESGNVYIPKSGSYSWVDPFEKECRLFPMCKHNDQVDTTSQALNRICTNSGEIFFGTL
jgi:predicted phage terminase large subunit-like protein